MIRPNLVGTRRYYIDVSSSSDIRRSIWHAPGLPDIIANSTLTRWPRDSISSVRMMLPHGHLEGQAQLVMRGFKTRQSSTVGDLDGALEVSRNNTICFGAAIGDPRGAGESPIGTAPVEFTDGFVYEWDVVANVSIERETHSRVSVIPIMVRGPLEDLTPGAPNPNPDSLPDYRHRQYVVDGRFMALPFQSYHESDGVISLSSSGKLVSKELGHGSPVVCFGVRFSNLARNISSNGYTIRACFLTVSCSVWNRSLRNFDPDAF